MLKASILLPFLLLSLLTFLLSSSSALLTSEGLLKRIRSTNDTYSNNRNLKTKPLEDLLKAGNLVAVPRSLEEFLKPRITSTALLEILISLPKF